MVCKCGDRHGIYGPNHVGEYRCTFCGEITESPKVDSVNNPSHYNGGSPYETIKVIEAWGLDKDYYLGNAVKYISRAGKKDKDKFVEDLEKAVWYIRRRIENYDRMK